MEGHRDPATRHLSEHLFDIAIKQRAVSVLQQMKDNRTRRAETDPGTIGVEAEAGRELDGA
jgi:hypothetical protein